MLLYQRILTLRNLDDPIGGHVLEFLDGARARPAHYHFVYHAGVIEAKILPQGILRSVAVAEHHFPHLLSSFDANRHSRAYGIAIGFGPDELYGQPVSLGADSVLEQGVP